MGQSQPVDASAAARPRFWVGPLLAGCCFAMGYGVTHRIISAQSSVKPVQTQRFAPSGFPGDSLQTLRSIHEGDTDLQVDLAARMVDAPEANKDGSLPALPPPETSLALQLPSVQESDWTAPDWSNPETKLPSPVSSESIQQDEQRPEPSSVLLAPSSAEVPAADVSLLVVEPEPPALDSQPNALFLAPMQPVMPPPQP